MFKCLMKCVNEALNPKVDHKPSFSNGSKSKGPRFKQHLNQPVKRSLHLRILPKRKVFDDFGGLFISWCRHLLVLGEHPGTTWCHSSSFCLPWHLSRLLRHGGVGWLGGWVVLLGWLISGSLGLLLYTFVISAVGSVVH